jgi:hypothetical protein
MKPATIPRSKAWSTRTFSRRAHQVPATIAPNIPPYMTRPPCHTAKIVIGFERNSWPTGDPRAISTITYMSRAPITTPTSTHTVIRE